MDRSLGARALLAVLLCAAVATPARADSARAEDLIRQANELRRQSKNPEAIPLYRQAYEIARSPRTAAQLGLVELALGYWLDAEDHLTEALAPARHPWIDPNRKVLEQSLAKARGHVGSLVIEGPRGADVRLNLRAVGSLPLPGPIRVGEGDVTVEVRAPNYKPETRTIRVRGGTTQRESFSLLPDEKALGEKPQLPPPPPPPPPPPEELPGWRRALPWTLVAGSAIAGGLAVWQHVGWRDAQGKFEQNRACFTGHPNRGTDPSCSGLYDTLAGHRQWTIVGYSVAGALGVGAAVTFILNAGAGSAETPRSAFGPGPAPLGISYGGRF